MLIDIGNPLPNLAVAVKDSNGNPADATSVVLTLTLPDQTTQAPAVAHPGTGSYTSSYIPVQTGRHIAYWQATGTNASAWTQIYDVVSAAASQIVNVDDVLEFLRLNGTPAPAAYIPRLSGFISAITAVVESITGPILPRTLDEYYDGGRDTILLNFAPVISVTSVVEAGGGGFIRTLTVEQPDQGSALDAYGYTLDLETGTLIRRISGLAGPFLPGKRNVHVVYVAGATNIPANVVEGALELIRVNWQTQTGATRPGYSGTGAAGGEAAMEGAVRMGYFVPNRVLEMLAPSRHVWGIA